MSTFWDRSWEKIQEGRLAEYIRSFDLQPDALIQCLLSKNVRTVCDAGCGCGIYARKLAANGFTVSGFDVSAPAVALAQRLLASAGVPADLKTASVLATGYPDEQFDCVLSRDVLDHISKANAMAAMNEFCRITRPGGIVLVTLDASDEEYEREPHRVNADGDYLFTSGKWEGMVFHPYQEQEIPQLLPPGVECCVTPQNGGWTLLLQKPA